MQGPQLEVGAEAAAQMITRFVHSQFLAFHNKPPYSNTSESKQIKLAAKHFHLACTLIRSLSSCTPKDGTLFLFKVTLFPNYVKI